MGFASGSVSFRRFQVTGQQPKQIDQPLLDKLEEYALQLGEYGVPDEIEYGWSGGRHILDARFTFENNVFSDALHFAMRVDTNRVPAALKRAYQVMEEEATAAQNPSGFISKQQKRDVKDVVRRKIEEDLKSGKFRRSKLVPMLWDLPGQTIYSPVSASMLEKLHELFERTFELQLEPLSAGTIAAMLLDAAGKRREYEDLRPTRFVPGPEGESQQPDYPWVAKGPQPKDFLGNEFLLWLWHATDTAGGTIKVDGGEVGVVIDKALEMDCAYGQTGKDTFRGDGPTRMPEARDALRSGKLPRRVGLLFETGGKTFELAFNGESFACSGTKLPEVEEAEDARVLFEERIAMLRDLGKGLDAMFGAFLKVRIGGSWESQVASIRRWILQSSKPQAAVA